jgi:hypothetical protein
VIILDPPVLKKELVKVFAHYYPSEIADALAVMHAQLHCRFVESMGGVPMIDGDTRKLIRGQPKLARSIARMKMGVTKVPMAQKQARHAELRQEILDMLESMGPERQSAFSQIRSGLAGFSASEWDVRGALSKLEKAGKIVRFGKTKSAKYSVPETKHA